MIHPFQQGARVSTPQGPGTVAYVRNGYPDYSEPVAVSVVLDARRERPGYAGSLFAVEDVSPAVYPSLSSH